MHVWRARLQRWFAPLAQRCPVSPNAISFFAMLLNAGAAVLFYFASVDARLFLVAMVIVIIAGLADAFDGIVARVQNKVSRYGDFLDHFFDRVSDLLIVAGWLIGSGVRVELAMIAVIAVMLNGYIGTQVEATWGERNYDSVGRGEFVLALIVFPIVSFILATNGWSTLRFARLAIAEWMTLLLVAFAILGIAQRFGVASRLDKQTERP
jgi:phosphatidylglycerophosphate synthase